MRKTLVYGTATAAVALVLTGCPAREVTALYGPPPDIEEENSPDQKETPEPSQPSQTEIDEPIEDVYGPPVDHEFEPVEDDEQDVSAVASLYGPPPEDIDY